MGCTLCEKAEVSTCESCGAQICDNCLQIDDVDLDGNQLCPACGMRF